MFNCVNPSVPNPKTGVHIDLHRELITSINEFLPTSLFINLVRVTGVLENYIIVTKKVNIGIALMFVFLLLRIECFGIHFEFIESSNIFGIVFEKWHVFSFQSISLRNVSYTLCTHFLVLVAISDNWKKIRILFL